MIGQDYAALPAVLELLEIPPPERPALFAQLRIMEAEALRILRPSD